MHEVKKTQMEICTMCIVKNYFNCKMVYLVHNKMRAHSAIININIGLKRAMHCPAANHAHAR